MAICLGLIIGKNANAQDSWGTCTNSSNSTPTPSCGTNSLVWITGTQGCLWTPLYGGIQCIPETTTNATLNVAPVAWTDVPDYVLAVPINNPPYEYYPPPNAPCYTGPVSIHLDWALFLIHTPSVGSATTSQTSGPSCGEIVFY